MGDKIQREGEERGHKKKKCAAEKIKSGAWSVTVCGRKFGRK